MATRDLTSSPNAHRAIQPPSRLLEALTDPQKASGLVGHFVRAFEVTEEFHGTLSKVDSHVHLSINSNTDRSV